MASSKIAKRISFKKIKGRGQETLLITKDYFSGIQKADEDAGLLL